MKITSIKQQIKNPERVSIFVDEKYEFSLSLDELVKYKLRNGEELDKGEVKKFKKISADGKLRARALEWLMNRPHSEREFRDYLYRKKAETEQIDNLVGEFSVKGYLDNAKFAVWYAELLGRRGKSNRLIKSELYAKGISREAVETVFETETSDEAERLRTVIAKKTKVSRYKNDKEKLMKFLASQGFGWQDIKDALKMDIPEE